MWSVLPGLSGKSSYNLINLVEICFCVSSLSWPPDDSVSILPVCISRRQFTSFVGPVRALEIIYSGTKRNQGKLLSSSSMTQPVCTQGSHPGSVAVDLRQITPSPPASWRLMILQLITVNRITVDLPQYYTPEHRPTRRADGWGWVALTPLGNFICSEHLLNAATCASYWFMKNNPI